MSLTMLKEKETDFDQLLENRVLGEYSTGKPGPTLICFCSIHGNEPSGMLAFRNVLGILRKEKIAIKGRVVGLAGNMAALRKHQRFIDVDMNRIWSSDRMKDIQNGTAEVVTSEDQEQMELLTELKSIVKQATGELFFIDLHTTSSESQPYISINDTLRNRRVALKYPLPIVLGLEEYLEGTILSYINELGHIALGFEAGQHDAPASVTNHEAIIWLSLLNSGCLNFNASKELIERKYGVLSKTIIDGKKVFELRHRHWVEPEDKFKMEPGYVNFQPIDKNELLAIDKGGQIRSGEKGRIFMPLYQSQGNDGFFIVRAVKWFWLKVSAMLRITRFHRLLHLLPGVGKYNRMNHSLIVNTKWARWYVIDFFHLMGFRRKQVMGKRIVFIKRAYDVRKPQNHLSLPD
ncbi:succinylglutamate desuccinylase/aspartoacylase family protein [Roseivirga sp.]|uniref:succinylglutamate desuccinylase/aspartoacylase family protein n=1 Tax=Roseivirga sp. TaxID=1964215 RepID=UPI003B51917A